MIDEIFKNYYVDGDGKLNFNQFVKAASERNYKLKVDGVYSEEERIFGPFPNKLFFKSIKSLIGLKDKDEIK